MSQANRTAIAASQNVSRPEHLDAWFKSHGYDVEKPVKKYERYNFRRILNQKTGNKLIVAYKTDRRLHETSNIFIETVSVADGESEAPGWAYDDRIQAYIIYSPQAAYFWFLPKSTLDSNLPRWIEKYETRSTTNPTYTTCGVVVPESELHEAGATRHLIRI